MVRVVCTYLLTAQTHTDLASFPGSFVGGEKGVYQALFPPPQHKSMGMRLIQNKQIVEK